MKLDCRTAQRMIQPYLDDSITDGDCASFLGHVRSCPRCREELETSFMITYVLKYIDDDREHSYDIGKLLDEQLAKSDGKLRRHRILSITIWTLIVVMGLLIAFILVSAFIPEILPEFGRTIANFFIDGFNALL